MRKKDKKEIENFLNLVNKTIGTNYFLATRYNYWAIYEKTEKGIRTIVSRLSAKEIDLFVNGMARMFYDFKLKGEQNEKRN